MDTFRLFQAVYMTSAHLHDYLLPGAAGAAIRISMIVLHHVEGVDNAQLVEAVNVIALRLRWSPSVGQKTGLNKVDRQGLQI